MFESKGPWTVYLVDTELPLFETMTEHFNAHQSRNAVIILTVTEYIFLLPI